jgi:hypothetical protein
MPSRFREELILRDKRKSRKRYDFPGGLTGCRAFAPVTDECVADGARSAQGTRRESRRRRRRVRPASPE